MNHFSRAIVPFCESLSVDGYQKPSGEYRVGIAGASTVLGFAKNWLGRVTEKENKTLEALQGLGFKGLQESGVVDGKTGLQPVTTISLDDFALLILYAASKGKKEAIALQLALTKMSLNDFFRDAFGERPLTIEEKRALFYQDYSKTINWLEEDKKDWSLIEDQERFLAFS